MTEQPRIASFRQLDEYLKKEGFPRDEQMIRNNIYIAPLEWLHIVPGFNLRPIDDVHVENFAKSYELGHYVPPIVAELTIVDGKPSLAIREGHHRLTGALRAVARGTALPGLMVSEFKGNQADAVVMMMMKTSEGKPLLPLERGEGYKRLAGQNWSPSQIADRLNRSLQHVEGLLLLANSEENVKQLVRDDKVSSTTVLEVLTALKGTGEDPYLKLAAMVETAQADGRQRATGQDANKALGKFKVTPKEAQAAFGALSGITGSLRNQVKAGGHVQFDVRLDPKAAESLLKILEKYEASQSTVEA